MLIDLSWVATAGEQGQIGGRLLSYFLEPRCGQVVAVKARNTDKSQAAACFHYGPETAKTT
jgi:hypothetical protein